MSSVWARSGPQRALRAGTVRVTVAPLKKVGPRRANDRPPAQGIHP
jgi:hypothetical protein